MPVRASVADVRPMTRWPVAEDIGRDFDIKGAQSALPRGFDERADNFTLNIVGVLGAGVDVFTRGLVAQSNLVPTGSR